MATTDIKDTAISVNGKGLNIIEKAMILPDLTPTRLVVHIKGITPLIVHAWSKKAQQEMLDKQMKKAAKAKEAKDPEQDFQGSLYKLDDGGYGFPSIAFKAAAVRAGTYADMKMTFLRGAFFVHGEFVKIEGCEPRRRQDMVRIGNGVADIRFRGEFVDWNARINVDFNERAISEEQVVQLFRIAGFAVGVGEWRPEKDGQYGRFEVVGAENHGQIDLVAGS